MSQVDYEQMVRQELGPFTGRMADPIHSHTRSVVVEKRLEKAISCLVRSVEMARFELFNPPSTPVSFTLSSLVGAALVGVAGARWITNEIDKKLLTAAASKAAAAPAAPEAAQQIVAASPAKALAIAQQL